MKFQRPTKKRSEVPIVPLIDILFTLLIFFVVSTNFKTPRHMLQLELPTVKNIPSETVSEQRTILAIDSNGKVALEGLTVPDGLLADYLAAFKKQNPQGKLELEADKALPLEKLLKLWDDLSKAGIPMSEIPTRVLSK